MKTYTQARWRLEDLLPGPQEAGIEAVLAELERHVTALEAARPYLSPEITETDFLKLLERYEQQSLAANRLSAYANLWFYEDTQNQAALNLRGRIDKALSQAGARTMFFTLWYKDLPEESATRLAAASGRLRYTLECLRRFKPYTLGEAVERAISLKDVDGIDALIELYDLITNRLVFRLEVDGVVKELTRDQLSAYFRSPSPAVRAAAYQELNRVFIEQATLLGQIYIHRIRDWHTEGIELRGFAQPIDYRNLINDIPEPVVETLLAVCRANAGVFQRYFRLKARWLGLEKLSRADIYAPLAHSERSYAYPAAIELVLESFRGFDRQVAEQVERVLNEAHLDSETRPGKRGGAFCYAAIPGLTPWVLVNYAGQGRDVATLAHELGHALHSMLSGEQSILGFRPSLPLAETASIFSEMLLTERLAKGAADLTERRELLAHSIDDAFATILRQAYFTVFERQAHQIIAEGGTIEALCDSYAKLLAEQFGQAVELDPAFRWEWISIPHIYKTPFYTYSYSFGQLLVLALFQQYKTLGAAFVPRYLKILSYGGSAAPLEILAEAGIDITRPEFWQGGFDVLNQMVDQLEEG